MYELTRNTIAKMCLVVVTAVMITASTFSLLAAGIFGSIGMYEESQKEFSKQVVSSIANETAYEIMNDYIHQDESIPSLSKYFEPADYPDYDFTITINKKSILSTYDGKTEYLVKGEGYSGYDNNEIVIYAYLKADAANNTEVAQLIKLSGWIYEMRTTILVAAIVLGVLGIIGFIILMKGAGLREVDNEVHDRKVWDHIPTDLYLAIDAIIVALIIYGGTRVIQINIMTGVIVCFLLGIICVVIALGFFMAFAVQIKQKRMLRGTVIGRVFRLIAIGIRALPITWKLVVPAAIVWIFLMAASLSSYNGFIIFCTFVMTTTMLAGASYLGIMLRRLEKGALEIAAGNTGYVIDTSRMIGVLRAHAEALNNINKGVEAAVIERMRSERFKTELITNVSHDIKTPLTSIINYTELLTHEDVDENTAKEYIDIIARNAERLKKLTSDIVSASKASTGNVDINRSECNIGIMLEQALGEYEEKMQDAGLIPIANMPDEDITVLADGEHSWRIMDNIMNNICKYAQPGTRVYMDVYEDDGQACISFKNTSAQALNINADELMERFVRGDSSRNTEGSGLGLSIARDLATLQGGGLQIYIDGDLFKVIVKFEKA